MVATLFVGNLNPNINEDMIGMAFHRFGDIQKSKYNDCLLIFFIIPMWPSVELS